MLLCSLMSVGNWSRIRDHNYHSSHRIMCFVSSLSLILGDQSIHSKCPLGCSCVCICTWIYVFMLVWFCYYAVWLRHLYIFTADLFDCELPTLTLRPANYMQTGFFLFLPLFFHLFLSLQMIASLSAHTSQCLHVQKDFRTDESVGETQQEDAGGLQWAAALRLVCLGSVIRQSLWLHTVSCSWW